MPLDDLDSLVKKAEALEAMVKRGDLTIKEAAKLMEAERQPWIERLTAQVLSISDDQAAFLKAQLQRARKERETK